MRLTEAQREAMRQHQRVQAGLAPKKVKCHLCKQIGPASFCGQCGHWLCQRCSGKFIGRAFAALKEAVGLSRPGCCGPVEETV